MLPVKRVMTTASTVKKQESSLEDSAAANPLTVSQVSPEFMASEGQGESPHSAACFCLRLMLEQDIITLNRKALHTSLAQQVFLHRSPFLP